MCDRSHENRRNDDRKRGPLSFVLGEQEHRNKHRHENDTAADAERRSERSGDEPQQNESDNLH